MAKSSGRRAIWYLGRTKNAVLNRKNTSFEGVLDMRDIKVTPVDDSITLDFDGQSLDMTHWSLGQLCNLAGAPASYLRTLPPELVTENLNFSLPKTRESAKLLLAADGTEMENAGLYTSDRDIFMFFIDENNPIEMGDERLSRGFFVWNSEVGKSSFGLMTFLYRYVCGNHIVWGAQEVLEIRVRHSPHAPSRAFSEIMPIPSKYVESSTCYETQTIKKATDRKHIDARVDLERQSGRLLNVLN